MPRVGGVFTLLSGSKGVPNTTIQSNPYNAQLDDFAQDANLARPITAGGTGATNASAARTNLGVGIGSNVQAYDAGLQSIAGLTTAANQMIYTTALDVYATTALTPFARTLLDDADAATMRATIGANSAANLTTGTLPNARLVGDYSFSNLALSGGITATGAGSFGSVTAAGAVTIGSVSTSTGALNVTSNQGQSVPLINLSSFAPGISFEDRTTGAYNAVENVDANLYRIWSAVNTDPTVLTERLRLNLTNGNLTLNGFLDIASGGTGATTVAAAKTNLGLNNVNNTSDANKPVSTAQQAAINAKPDKTYVDAQDALRVSKTGDTMSGSLTLKNSELTFQTPSQSSGYQWSLRGGHPTDIWLRWFYNNGTELMALSDTGRLWIASIGDVSDRIELRAGQYADNRVSNLATRWVARAEINMAGGGSWREVPAGAAITGLYLGSSTRLVDYLCYRYFQLFDPVRGWITANNA
ncbi:hypothetical protein [Agrobacterium sp. OT33]|uniref:hypothetical protein n=1 Tax=Agrobacterium sp. OT33 TaxID=2815338 RepID=UPI001FEFDFC1|nr:hypothetical protein [Agrobacterium sp. OT33]